MFTPYTLCDCFRDVYMCVTESMTYDLTECVSVCKCLGCMGNGLVCGVCVCVCVWCVLCVCVWFVVCVCVCMFVCVCVCVCGCGCGCGVSVCAFVCECG